MMIRRQIPALLFALLLTFSLASQSIAADIPAFPGAEGYGAATTGGRGGKVFVVTNLNDSGPGSLREAVEAQGPRIVTFAVSGTIMLESALSIRNPNITIAGQTAPGDGICIGKHQLSIGADDVVIRYIRVRFGDLTGNDSDAIGSRGTKNIILDHVSASWSVDETMSIYHCENVTVQWCMITESLYMSKHAKGHHGFGGIWGSNYSSYHHNLIAHHSSRNPRFASGCGFTDYRNNVLYNWGYNSAYGGEKEQRGNPRFNFTSVNMVANYYKPGPATRPGNVSHRIVNPAFDAETQSHGMWYVAENVVEGNFAVTADNWNGGVQPGGGNDALALIRLEQPWDAMPIRQQTATDAYASVLEHAGASLPRRDAIDIRIIGEVKGGFATCEGSGYREGQDFITTPAKTGIIDSQTDVGGWPELKSAPAPADADHDGIPDGWERTHGLNPADPSDSSSDLDHDGYTSIEEYLNGTDPTVFVDYTKPENNLNTLN